jgi:hypothetical protein
MKTGNGKRKTKKNGFANSQLSIEENSNKKISNEKEKSINIPDCKSNDNKINLGKDISQNQEGNDSNNIGERNISVIIVLNEKEENDLTYDINSKSNKTEEKIKTGLLYYFLKANQSLGIDSSYFYIVKAKKNIEFLKYNYTVAYSGFCEKFQLSFESVVDYENNIDEKLFHQYCDEKQINKIQKYLTQFPNSRNNQKAQEKQKETQDKRNKPTVTTLKPGTVVMIKVEGLRGKLESRYRGRYFIKEQLVEIIN